MVPGTGYRWHEWPDGAATFALPGGGWILVSNSETRTGGASAIRFAADGEPRDAYRILAGTGFNCGGGPTPWGTWLSCEEFPAGRVWECDPHGERAAVVHPAMGVFKHESAAVDPVGRRVYMTEDLADGAFYRYTPRRWRDLSAGRLEVATVSRAGRVRWSEVRDPGAVHAETRRQVRGSTRFKRAEGIWFDRGTIFISTTYDTRVRAYDPRRERMAVLYDGLASEGAPLLRVDQMTASPAGEVFVRRARQTLTRRIGLFGSGRRNVHGFGPRRDLLGRAVAELDLLPPSRLRARLYRARDYTRVRPGAGYVPALVRGWLREVARAGGRWRSRSTAGSRRQRRPTRRSDHGGSTSWPWCPSRA